jgi:hypothetical protein
MSNSFQKQKIAKTQIIKYESSLNCRLDIIAYEESKNSWHYLECLFFVDKGLHAFHSLF